MQIIHQAPLAALGLGAAFTVVWGVADPVAALAEVHVIEADGYYIMGDGPEENAAVAKERARADARRAASEQAGLYVASITEVKKGKLTRDEVRMISACVLQVQEDKVTPEVMGGSVIQYHCHMKALVDTGSISDQLQQDQLKLDEAVKRNKELEAEVTRVNEELAKIKAEYQNASENEKQRLNEEMKQNERRFQAVAWVERGEKYMDQANDDQYPKAMDCFQKAAAADPGYAKPWARLGFIYQEWEDYSKAVECCRKALALDPKEFAAWSTLSVVYRKQQHFDKALEYSLKAVELAPGEGAGWNSLGNVYYKMGNVDKAIEYWHKVTQISPKSAKAWYNLGRAYIERGDYQKGLAYCRRAVEIAPRFSMGWNSIGVAYVKLGKQAEALEAFNKALEADPANKVAQKNKDKILAKL